MAITKMPKREYNILPQADDFHHHIMANPQRRWTQFIIIFTTAIILLILAGIVTLTYSVYFHDENSNTNGINHVWKTIWGGSSDHMADTSDSSTATTPAFLSLSSFPQSTAIAEGNEVKEGSKEGEESNSGDYLAANVDLADKPNASNGKVSESGEQLQSNNSSTNEDSGQDNIELDRNTTESLNATSLSRLAKLDAWFKNMTGKSLGDVSMEELKENLAEQVRDFEKHLETWMGIPRPEFVVPLFMLMSFLLLFAVIALCCCFIMKRRESRRKKYYGKLITDLQTGDSKTVLLNHTDYDE